jgi:cytochrome c oxidase cbb3-type subunit I
MLLSNKLPRKPEGVAVGKAFKTFYPVKDMPDVKTDETYKTVRGFFLASAIYFVIAALAGVILASWMVAPDFPLYKNVPWLLFSRVRPAHTNLMIFGFVGSALMGAVFYFVPRLSRVHLYSRRLGRITLWVWNAAIIIGEVCLLFGLSQSREYAEWIWPADILVLIAFALAGYNLLKTMAEREEKLLYVSTWYAFASLLFIWLIYFFGNAVWNPRTGAIEGGIPDGILAWFYGHGVVGLFLTPLAVGLAYYVIPIVTKAPLFSHALSLVGFWSILVFYPHIGGHHLLQTPTPTWHKILSVTGSIGMLIPVLTVLVNLFMTARGRWGNIHADIGGKFVFAGLVWYLFVCLQGPYQALPSVQRVTHLTNWVVAHSHIAVAGFSGFIALGGVYFMIPRITNRPLYSKKLADIQYWLFLTGLTGFFVILTIVGLIQGSNWLNGVVEYKVLPQMHVYFVYRLGFGVLIVLSAFLGLYNIVRSLYGRKAQEEEP